jgi:PAS domain S-box-containing protein
MATPKGAAVNILLVDDRPENLVSLKAILSSADYRLITASSGEEALKIALREDLAVILLDVVMPSMDGFEVAKHLKKIERTSRVPVIFLTAVATEVRQIYLAYSAGAVDYLIKPLDTAIVRMKVAVFVDLYLQRREVERQARILRENERREYELRLAELRVASDNRYRKLVEGIDHAIAWSMDPATARLSFISRQAERIMGYSAEELSQPDFWARHVPLEDRDRVLQAFRAASPDSADQSIEHGFLAAGRRRLWLHTGLSAVREAEGARRELHGISIDVTNLKRAEEAEQVLAQVVSVLAESFDYETAMTSLAQVVVPRLADWCVIDVTSEDSVRQAAVAHVDPAKAQLARELARRHPVNPDEPYGVARVLRSGKAEIYPDVSDAEWVAKELGIEHPAVLRELGAVSYMIVPLRARGHTLAAMTLVSSESQRRFEPRDLVLAEEVGVRAALVIDNARLYQGAQRATAAREDILRTVSHDLKNPLSVIMTSTERLTKVGVAEGGVSQTKKISDAIRRASQRMIRLIDELLDMERIEAHHLFLDRRDHEAASLVSDSVELLEPLASEKSITIRADMEAARSVRVQCDRNRILQVFANLVGNAIKFTPEGGSVIVRVTQQAGVVLFAITDDGAGIAPDQLPHVFDRYWQARETAHLGTGLGLAIVKGIVEAHGGRTWVESEVGKGSTFFFTLPRANTLDDQPPPPQVV